MPPILDEKHILECIDIAVNNAQLASKFSVLNLIMTKLEKVTKVHINKFEVSVE